MISLQMTDHRNRFCLYRVLQCSAVFCCVVLILYNTALYMYILNWTGCGELNYTTVPTSIGLNLNCLQAMESTFQIGTEVLSCILLAYYGLSGLFSTMQLYCIVCIVKSVMLVHASPAPLLGEKMVFQIVNKVYCYWEVSYVTDVFFFKPSL